MTGDFSCKCKLLIFGAVKTNLISFDILQKVIQWRILQESFLGDNVSSATVLPVLQDET